MKTPEPKESTNLSQEKDITSPVIPLRSVFYFLAASLTVAIVLEFLPLENYSLHWSKTAVQHANDSEYEVVPTYAIYGKSLDEDHLVHVKNVLKRLGYRRVNIEDGNWNLLWAHDYPFFVMSDRLKNLNSFQMVNHWPGCGFLANKVDLSTTILPFLPRAFRLPRQSDEFLNYARENTNALFVEKHNEHRHIAIRSPSAIDLNTNDSFVQEYIQNPFLVDGYKFDIGVYVVITSINPLRAYIYSGDVLFRYCPVKYYPFDPNNIDKYVVGDDYLPTWEVPSLKKYYEIFSGSMRDSFDAYVRDQNLDPLEIWEQVENIIRTTILAKEQDIENILRSYNTRNFFDLLRFDLIIDSELRVWLMECNMSPNLSSAHFKPNALLYEQIIYSTMNLIGLRTLSTRSDEKDEIITSEKNIAVNLNKCARYGCDKNCNLDECHLCLPCLSGTDYNVLKQAHKEHLHKIDMRRIFPKPVINAQQYDIENEVANLSKKNEWLTRWFWDKCQVQHNWCT